MKQLFNNKKLNAFFFREMFLQKLSPNIQQLIAVNGTPDASLEQLVAKADKAYEITYSSIGSCSWHQSLIKQYSPEYPSFGTKERAVRIENPMCAQSKQGQILKQI